MKRIQFITITMLLLFLACQNQQQKEKKEKKDPETFSFVFMTDIHLQPERHALEGFHKAIKKANSLNPDFVLMGGDMIMDALGQSYQRADSLYTMYNKAVERLKMPVHHTIGNHEVFGLYEESGISPDHELYKEKMYEERIGKRYYTFSHKGWQFMVLDAIGQTDERRYIGHVDSVQQAWIQSELEQISKDKPIVLSVHIPFLTVFPEVTENPLEGNGRSLVITNGDEVLELFQEHNLKLALQGHLHFLEDIKVQGTHFITSGAVSGQWWRGPNYGVEEGFLEIKVKGDAFTYEYIDYGWEAKK